MLGTLQHKTTTDDKVGNDNGDNDKDSAKVWKRKKKYIGEP